MAKKYVEVIVALDESAPSVLEVSSREREDEGEWSAPVEGSDSAPTLQRNFPWLHLEITRI